MKLAGALRAGPSAQPLRSGHAPQPINSYLRTLFGTLVAASWAYLIVFVQVIVVERIFFPIRFGFRVLCKANLEKSKQTVNPGTQFITKMKTMHTLGHGLIKLRGSARKGRRGIGSKIMIKSRVFPTAKYPKKRDHDRCFLKCARAIFL